MVEWSLAAVECERSVVVEAPVEVEGWERRPWVRLRGLTEGEALERESLGMVEEYELVTRGLDEPGVRVRRTYDLKAMAEYDLAHCVLDGCLPEVQPDGEVREWRVGDGEQRSATELLERMQPALAAWLRTEIERVNWRLPEQRALVEKVKKS